MPEYKNQPLIYVANAAKRTEVTNAEGFDSSKAVIFQGTPKLITTHNTEYYCASQNIDTYISTNNTNIGNINDQITGIITRLNNVDGAGNQTIATRLTRLETLLNGPADSNNNNLADFLELLSNLSTASEATQTTVITTINSKMDEIEFWYTHA